MVFHHTVHENLTQVLSFTWFHEKFIFRTLFRFQLRRSRDANVSDQINSRKQIPYAKMKSLVILILQGKINWMRSAVI